MKKKLDYKTILRSKEIVKDTIIGSVNIQKNAQLTRHKGKYSILPSPTVAKILYHIKFSYSFMVGVIHRKENGIPFIEYEYIDVPIQVELYNEELSHSIYTYLFDMFKRANPNTRLTTFWIATTNKNISTEEIDTFLLLLLDEYRVYDNMLTYYEITNNKEVGRTLHLTTYWYSLLELEEIFLEERIE